MMPGLYLIDTDATGERSFSYWRSTSAARQMFAPDSGLTPEFLDGVDTLYLSGITIAILDVPARDRLADGLTRFRPAAEGWHSIPTIVRSSGPMSPPRGPRCLALSRLTDIAFPSQDDEVALFGEAGTGAILDRYAQRASGKVR